jgi:hypothetical protein
MIQLGSWSRISGQSEVQDLQAGMDFRLPQYRREVFLRFYEFHLRYRAHPGCVYYLMPHLADKHRWGPEEKLWFAFINGNTQNPVTSWLIFREFPSLVDLDMERLGAWFQENYTRLPFDTDRRYHKKHFMVAIASYQRILGGQTQEEFFGSFAGRFIALWTVLNTQLSHFGRLSCFSYMEYLRIMGVEVDCDRLFLEDMQGSKSHRNGLCKVLGRDDLDWHDSNPGFDGKYGAAGVAWLTTEGSRLLQQARTRFAGRDFERDVSYFTLESALCTYKSWHRPRRRYPNVYNDMLVERIRTVEAAWGPEPARHFWEARVRNLPEHLRLEHTPHDLGVHPTKQDHYRLTGEVIMMDREWPCFRNAYNDGVNERRAR